MARDIASVLGSFSSKDGYMENGQYVVSWALGHLVELAQPHDYEQGLKEWSLKKLPIIPNPFKLKPSQGTSAKQLAVIKKLMKTSKEIGLIINACDAGREGELIFRRIFTWCGCEKPVKRLWLSEATASAVKKALNSLKDGREMDNLAAAAEARGKADWLIGINATRAFSVRHNAVLSVGRVQTPTLAMVVEREREIRNFKPEKYWELWATFQKKDGRTYRGKWFNENEKSDRLKQKEQAETIAGEIASNGKVTRVEQKETQEKPPLFFNLNDLQKESNKRYGLTAQQTLDIAQALYEKHKLLTYPRTDSRHLTTDLAKETLDSRLAALAVAREYMSLVPERRSALGSRYVDDTKVTDHHAIIPTIKPDPAVLSENERLVYDLVVRRFLAAFYPEARYAITVIVTSTGDQNFSSKGKVELDPGWKAVYTSSKPENKSENEENEQTLPPLAQGEVVSVNDIDILEKQTKPPARYTEATLLAAMENAGRLLEDKEMAGVLKQSGGIGTPATRAATIERLIKVAYIQRQKKHLVPTQKGETIIDLLPQQVKSPEMTARWEKGLDDIEKGRDPERWIKEIIKFTKELVELAANQEKTQNISAGKKKEAIGRCPLCAGDVLEFPKSYGCAGYKEGCKFTIWKEIAGKKITASQAKALLKNGKTGTLKGFKSKSKKPFSAALAVNEEGKVVFEFGNRGY